MYVLPKFDNKKSKIFPSPQGTHLKYIFSLINMTELRFMYEGPISNNL